MAGYNPFRTFRKKQKLWLAILGVGTMISFIIVPALMHFIPSGGGAAVTNDVAKTRRFGTVTLNMIASMDENRNELRRFYRTLYQELQATTNQENQALLTPLVMKVNEFENSRSPEDTVNTWMIVQYAQEQGLSVTPDMIVSYLSQLTGGLLSDDIFNKTIKAVGLTEQRFAELMTPDMLLTQMLDLFRVSQGPVTPLTRWEWFQRMNRQISLEVAAVPVDRFIDQVPEPTETQLRQLFEEGRKIVANPSSHETGFTVPQKIAFQYVKAVPGQKTLDSITQEEIEQYYEANKEEMFRKPVQPIGERPSLPGQTPGSIFQPGLGGFTPRSTPFPTPMTRPGAPQGVIQVTPTEGQPEGETPTEQPQSDETTPATEETAPTPAPESAPATESAPTEEGQPAAMVKRPVTRFVSYQSETDSPGATEPQAEETKPAEAEAKPESAPEETPTPVTATSEEKPVEEKADETPVDLSILYRPLSEVEGEIREILAREKVNKSIELIENKMREYFQEYYTFIEQGKPAPEMFDLKTLVKEQDMELVSVAAGTIDKAVQTEFGRGRRERSHLLQTFSEGAILFEPRQVIGDEDTYLFQVTEIIPEFEPQTLSDVRDDVVRRWKEIQARSLAMKKAEELVAEAKAAGKSLAETFSGQDDLPVVETEPFLWKTYGPGMNVLAEYLINQGHMPSVDEIREKGVEYGAAQHDNKQIVAWGNDFMKSVFAMSVGDIGAVFNQPQTVAYVVRVTASTPSMEVLWEQFQTASPTSYTMVGQMEDRVEAFEAWLERIRRDSGFKWINKPEDFRRRR